MLFNGVIESSTGNLLRYGDGVDFENDGQFDSGTESYMEDAVPLTAKRKGEPGETMMSHWTGTIWDEVSQP